MPIVEIKDYGVEVEFPDSMAPEAIQAALRDRVMPELQRRQDRTALESMTPFGRAQVLERSRNGGAKNVQQAIQQIAGDYLGAAPSGPPITRKGGVPTSGAPAGAAPFQIPAGMGTPERAGLVPRQDVPRETSADPLDQVLAAYGIPVEPGTSPDAKLELLRLAAQAGGGPEATLSQGEQPALAKRLLADFLAGTIGVKHAPAVERFVEATPSAEGLPAALAGGAGGILDPISLAAMGAGGAAAGTAAKALGAGAKLARVAGGAGGFSAFEGAAEAGHQVESGDFDPVEIAKALGKGAALGTAIAPAHFLGSPVARYLAESAIFGTASPLTEGRMPTAEDYAHSAAFIGMLHSVQGVRSLAARRGLAKPKEYRTAEEQAAVEALPPETVQAIQAEAREAMREPGMTVINRAERIAREEPTSYQVQEAGGAPKATPLPRETPEATRRLLAQVPDDVLLREAERPNQSESRRALLEEELARRTEGGVAEPEPAGEISPKAIQAQRKRQQRLRTAETPTRIVGTRDLNPGDRVRTRKGPGQVVKRSGSTAKVVLDSGETMFLYPGQEVRVEGSGTRTPPEFRRPVEEPRAPRPLETARELQDYQEIVDLVPEARRPAPEAPARPLAAHEAPPVATEPPRPVETAPVPAAEPVAQPKPDSALRDRFEKLDDASLARIATSGARGAQVAREILAERQRPAEPAAETPPAQEPPEIPAGVEPPTIDLAARRAERPTGREGIIRVEPLRAQAPADPEGFAPEAKWGRDWWTEGLQNSLVRIDRIEKWGRSRGATAQPGKAAEAYIGRAGHRIDQATDALEAILKPAFKEGFKPSELGRYMQALHAEERQRTMAERGFKGDNAAGMTADEAGQFIASMPPEIKKHAQKIRDYIDETLDIMVEGQLIPKDVAAEWRQRWPNYVPLLRDFGAGDAVSPGGGGRGFGASAGVKRAKGSKREALPILAQVATARARAIEMAERGRVGREMLKLIEEAELEKHGWRVEDAEGFFVDKDGELVLRDALKDMKNKDNVIAVPVEGRTVKIVIPPDQKGLIRAMQGLGVERSLPVFSQINHFLRYMATTGNLEFLVTNFTRDLQEAGIHLGERGTKMQGSVIRDVPAALRGVAEHLAGKDTEWARWREEMASEGGLTHWSKQSRDVNKMAAEIEKLAGRIEQAKTPEARAAAAIRTIGAGVEAMNAVVEGGVRLSAYANLRKSGVAPREAALFAKNMTLNFDKKGRWGGFIGSAYLFFNVGVQGPVRMMQFAKKNPARFASVASALAVSGYLEAMHNHAVNKDEYEKRSPWERDNYWTFMFAGDKGSAAVLRVPYGYSMFKALGGMAYDLHAGLMQERDAADRAFSVLVDGFSPIQGRTLAEFITPSAGDPIVQLGQNQNFFGAPIRPEQPPYGAKKPDSQLYFKSARPYSVALAKKLNEATGGNEVLSGWVDISPETMDYLTDFIGGGAGKMAGRTTNTITSLVRGETIDPNQVPFARQFYRVSNKYAERSAVYHMLDESARRIYTDAEVEKFNIYLSAAVEDGLLDKTAAKRIGRDFAKNQAKALASKKE